MKFCTLVLSSPRHTALSFWLPSASIPTLSLHLQLPFLVRLSSCFLHSQEPLWPWDIFHYSTMFPLIKKQSWWRHAWPFRWKQSQRGFFPHLQGKVEDFLEGWENEYYWFREFLAPVAEVDSPWCWLVSGVQLLEAFLWGCIHIHGLPELLIFHWSKSLSKEHPGPLTWHGCKALDTLHKSREKGMGVWLHAMVIMRTSSGGLLLAELVCAVRHATVPRNNTKCEKKQTESRSLADSELYTSVSIYNLSKMPFPLSSKLLRLSPL